MEEESTKCRPSSFHIIQSVFIELKPSITLSFAHHRAESPGIADVPKMEDKVNTAAIHLLENHMCGVEGVRLNVVEQKEASILLTTTHV